MGPPLAAGIAAIAAAIGLLIARYVATRRGAVLEDRIVWLVCAPMLLSGSAFLAVALAMLSTAPPAALLLGAWGAINLGFAAVTLTRMSRGSLESRPTREGGRPTYGPLHAHVHVAIGLLAAGAVVATVGLAIWATSQ